MIMLKLIKLKRYYNEDGLNYHSGVCIDVQLKI